MQAPDRNEDNDGGNEAGFVPLQGDDKKGEGPIEGMEALNDHDRYLPESERMCEEELSFYSASENEHGDDNIWGLLSGVGGNIFEWYDFACYGLLAPEIGQNFFPKSSRELQLINSFGVYLAAFIMRPLGAILFGEMGDRIVGRKHALAFSIILITVPSVLLGFLPTYEMWGPIAPICLVILRMLQGLSVGGQLAGSYVLSIEQSSSKTRGFRGSVCDASSVGGFLLASVYLSELRGVMQENEADLMNFFVVGCYIFMLLLAGKLSDMFPHRMDLVRIGLPGVIVGCPVMFGMFESESYWGCLFGQLQFAFCLSLVQGCMAAWEVELWMADPTLSFTGVAIGHNIAATAFGGTMPLIATFSYYRSVDLIAEEDDEESLYPRLLPGLYISFLGCVSLYCISYIIRHPHDVRTGSNKLREAIRKENQKFKQAQKEKLKRRKMLKASLNADITTATGISAPVTASFAEPPYVPPAV